MTYAQFETSTADLTSDFGLEKAREWFGDEAVDALPKFVRGKNAGKPKGIYQWTKITRGGWVKSRDMPGGGYVENRRGAIIERKLMERCSGPCGVFPGETIIRLGQSQTVAQKEAEKVGRQIAYWSEQMVSLGADVLEKLDTIERLGSALLDDTKAEKHELIAILIEDERKALGLLKAARRKASDQLANIEAVTGAAQQWACEHLQLQLDGVPADENFTEEDRAFWSSAISFAQNVKISEPA